MHRAKKIQEYDYEALYTKRSGIDINSGIFRYRTKTIKAGQMVECEIYPIWSTRNAYRKAKEQATRPSQCRLNQRNSIKQLVRLVNANFTAADIWLTLTYPPDRTPGSREEATKDATNYLRRLRRAVDRSGYEPLKYIIVTELHDRNGKETRIHHHIITNFPDRDTAERLWHKGGRTQSRRLQPDDFELEGLARYIGKEKESFELSVKSARRWRCSKNLIKPTITIADTRVTRRQIERLATASEEERERFFIRIYPDLRYLDCSIRYSDIVPGAYIHARLRKKALQQTYQKPKRLMIQQRTRPTFPAEHALM